MEPPAPATKSRRRRSVLFLMEQNAAQERSRRPLFATTITTITTIVEYAADY
jgi:hypothetical protein